MQEKGKIYLAVSLDVEEEGLFTGTYAQTQISVTNTQSLSKLLPLIKLGIRPTLFTAYHVFLDQKSRNILANLRDAFGCEIAAHLHFWNTPPLPKDLAALSHPLTRVPAFKLGHKLFAAKLNALLNAACDFQKEDILSFRMGRWDMHEAYWETLARAHILTDASVRPVHGTESKEKQPNFFLAQATPYWIPTKSAPIFEVPLTVTPLFNWLPKALVALESGPEFCHNLSIYLQARMNYWGALALLPVYQPLWMLKLITEIYVARGGKVISITWHSSEMMPGATPHLPTNSAVDKFLNRVQNYLLWLTKRYDIVSLTMNDLRNTLGGTSKTVVAPSGSDFSVTSQ